jgi:hypothetical protein
VMLTEDELLEREAKQRCLAAGVSLSQPAGDDRRYRHDDVRPWWQAEYMPRLKRQIEELRDAGFNVTPREVRGR